MLITNTTKPIESGPPDLLPVIHRSRLLPESKFEEVCNKVLAGVYPRDPVALATHLVKAQILTEYQAHRLLKNRPNGFVIGRYVILDRIGAGSMARVYKARHVLMDRIVALKLIAPEYVASPRKRARFQREIRLIGRLDHPNVVRAYDADEVSKVPFIAMEFVQGQTLSERLRANGPLPPDEVIDYAAQAALGLAHAHDQGVVHRDIKPSNLFIRNDQQLKILDFGLGILMENDEDDTFATNDGVAVGTIDYMSPEQTCGQDLDGRSDLYSLGCAMYHLMTQKLLFPGSSTIERMANRIKGHPMALDEMHPEFPPQLTQVMEKMLAPKVENRYQTAKEAADALRSLQPRYSMPLSLGSISSETYPTNGAAHTHSTNGVKPPERSPAAISPAAIGPATPGAALPPLFRILLFLAEQPVAHILGGAAGVIFLTFLAGFMLARLWR
ncbi:MAG TPA: serine/threonine-protein kinase [Isosphaeraceae bacterium]|jgi:serine/threonine-protein kinase|nr:serine/threonine-protein kinase [Isosphaeraceae bacterium]